MRLEQLLQDIDAKEAEFAHSPLMIACPDKEQEGWLTLVCQTYLSSAVTDQASLKGRLANKAGILNSLLGFAYQCAETLKKTKNVDWLRLGLAASYLAQMRMDYREVLLAWAELYVVAEEVGLTPAPEFEAICKLDNFDNYAVVASRKSGTYKIVQ